MNSALGMAGVALGLSACALGAVTVFVGLIRHRPRLVRGGLLYAGLAALGGVVAVVAMQRALITRDFSLDYVARVGSTRTPPLYNVAAMWSSLEGSILLWVVIQALFLAAVAWRMRQRLREPLVGWLCRRVRRAARGSRRTVLAGAAHSPRAREAASDVPQVRITARRYLRSRIQEVSRVTARVVSGGGEAWRTTSSAFARRR